MNDLIDKLTPLLDKLASKLGDTAQQVWAMQLLQAKVELVAYLVYYIIIAFMWVLVYKGYKWANEDSINDWDMDINGRQSRWNSKSYEFQCIIIFVLSVVTVILTGINAFNIKDVIILAINPEYWALTQLIHLVK